MWLGSGIAVAVVQTSTAASIPPLAWELPYAAGATIKREKKKKKKRIRIMLPVSGGVLIIICV